MLPGVVGHLLAFIFETPLAAFAAAVGAVALPILIHLLNRRRFQVVPWAAMRFLLAAQRKNRRRLRLEQWLLLAVRTLIVLLLVLAMASVMPWAEELWFRLFPAGALQAATSGRRTHKILVLDGSFSMATRSGESSCFERARAAARQVLQDSLPGDGFSVLLMAAPPRALVPEASQDIRKVALEVEDARLPHGNADLAATLNTVHGLLQRSPGKFNDHEVYFFTDLQRSTWLKADAPGAQLLGQLHKIQARAHTVFVDVGQDGIDNVAVTNLTVDTPLVTTGTVTSITATLHNHGAESRKRTRVELHIGKARASLGEPALALHLAAQSTVDLMPGQNSVSFAYKFASPGDYAVQVRVETDALDLDDTRTVVVRVRDNVPVMLVNGKPAADVYDRATEWLSDALNPFPKEQVPRLVAARPRVVTESQFADAGLGDLAPYDCVFLCDVARLDAGETRRLETHLRAGGGVVFCLGPHIDLEAYNRLLYRNGAGILPARLIGKQEAPDKYFFNFFVDDKLFHEPPLGAFAGERDRLSLLTARFRQYIRAELPPNNAVRKVLAFMPEAATVSAGIQDRTNPKALPIGDPALVEWPRYRGRVVLFTSTVNMDWTTWPISPSFPALMQELLPFAVAGRRREQALTVGEPLEDYLPASSAGLEATLQLPDGRMETIRTESRDDVSLLHWTGTDQSGIYRAVLGQHPQEHLFAVNVPTASATQQASESDLARTNQAELQSLYPEWDFQLVTDVRQVVHGGGSISEGTSPLGGIGMVVARWLLLLLLVLVAAEVVLAWRFGHYTGITAATEAPPAAGRLLPALVGFIASTLFLVVAAIFLHATWTGDFLGFLPEALRRAIEERLGVPAPAAGEGTRWHLEFAPYFWDTATDPWLSGVVALAMSLLVLGVYFREGTTTGPAYKLLLAALRLLVILLTLVVLLPQLRLSFERESWPDVAIVIDDSRSMSTADRYHDTRVQEATERLVRELSLHTPQRLQLAQALLARSRSGWLEALLSRRCVKLHVYHCSNQAARLTDITEPGELEAAVQAIQQLRAEGDSSHLGSAVRQVLSDFRGSPLSAILMLTDGVTTEGEDLAKVSHYAAQMGVPLFFVGLGDVHELRNLELHDLQVEDTVHVNDRLVFEARLTAQGHPEPRSVIVTLSEKDKSGKLKRLNQENVTTDPRATPVKFRLLHQPTEPGEKLYVIEALTGDDNSGLRQSPHLERTILVQEAKVIKVLYIEGYARYEYRYLKHLLERENNQEKGNKSVDLKVLLIDADPEYASEDKSAIPDFPTKEELNAYDVVLLGDVDPKDKKIGERNLQNLAEFVKERGGGLLMIAGPRSYSPHAYKNMPLADILPVQIGAGPPADVDRLSGFRPEITAAGRFHPMLRFSIDETENSAIWNSLPELRWWSLGYRQQPAAEVLLVHPQRPAEKTQAAGTKGPERHPLLLQQFVGAGRSMFLGFDETWSWRFRDSEPHFNQFWIQTIRHLARSRTGRIELRLDRQNLYRRGEPIRVTVRFPEDASPPAPDAVVEVVLTRTPLDRTGLETPVATEVQKETLRLAKVEGSRASYETLVSRTPEGEYRFRLTTPLVADPKPGAECRVLPPPGEMEDVRLNQAELEKAAADSHGRFYTLAEADQFLTDLPTGLRITISAPQPPRLLWNHSAVFGLVIGLLGSEWILRKRRHLP